MKIDTPAPKTPRDETTGAAVASEAARLLRDPATPRNVRSIAASALTQVRKLFKRKNPG